MTLTPADDWQAAIRDHDGNGIITLADGIYTASGPIEVRGRKTHIRAETIGGARIVGRWNFLPGDSALLEYLDLAPPAGDRLIYAELAWLELRDCEVEAAGASIDTLVQFSGGKLRITSRDRVSLWTIGPGITAEALDLDGATLKVIGNVTTNDVRFNLQAGGPSTTRVFTLDNTGAVFAGVRMYGFGNPRTGRAIDARRGSRVTIQDTGNRIQGFKYGIIARQYSLAHIDGITLAQCDVALWQRDAAEIVKDTGVVLDTNGKDHSI